jgi:diketogulonate reductase-like aldo/keto reductase
MQVVEAHGARIPQIGLGTMTLKDDVCVCAVDAALHMGYRHLDTAAFYANEKENGEGLRQSGVKRDDVFICTKVRQGDLMPDAFAKVLEQSLANLKLPYVDLLLIHWNNADIPLKLSVGALCKAKKEATRLQSDRDASLHQPGQSACRLQETWHGGCRILSDRARQGSGCRRA